MTIPCANPKEQYLSYRGEIDSAIQRVLNSGWYVLGEEVDLFENEFAQFNTVSHAIGVGSGTDALFLMLLLQLQTSMKLQRMVQSQQR